MNYADRINAQITMEQFAERYGFEVKKGFMRCPFHNEKTASLKLYPEHRGFYCFGCGAGGTVFNFAERYFKLDYQETCRKLDNDFNLGLYRRQTLTQYRRAKRAEKALEAERQRLKLDEEYGRMVFIKLTAYRKWLTRQEQTLDVLFDIAYIDRLLDRHFYDNDALTYFNVDALICALHSKHRR